MRHDLHQFQGGRIIIRSKYQEIPPIAPLIEIEGNGQQTAQAEKRSEMRTKVKHLIHINSSIECYTNVLDKGKHSAGRTARDYYKFLGSQRVVQVCADEGIGLFTGPKGDRREKGFPSLPTTPDLSAGDEPV
jgi:hypothetical protein